MQFFAALLNGLLIWFFPAAVAFSDHPKRDDILLVLSSIILTVFVSEIMRWLRGFAGARVSAPQTRSARNLILVDGSNVMHWGGDPSMMVLTQVLDDLQKRGFTPYVYFDANVGFKLFNQYARGSFMADQLKLEPWQVVVVKGGVTADEQLLKKASQDGLRVVTNDRFRDWKVKFPAIGTKGFLVKGKWQQGTVLWQNLGHIAQQAA